MTHPEDLLAGFVDGTLRDDERAVVDAHLEACELCREEVELARGAVAALATLEELPVPLGVTGPVLTEARRAPERTRRGWQRLQWAAGAAAAALVLVVAVNLSLGGSDDEAPDSAAGGDAALDAPVESAEDGAARDVALEVQDANYTDEGIRSLAEQAAATQTELAAPPAAEESRAAADPIGGLRCLEISEAPVDDPSDVLIRLIEAEYKHIPAYIAVFEESPGADQPADRVVVWVVAKDDCRNLTFAQVPS